MHTLESIKSWYDYTNIKVNFKIQNTTKDLKRDVT